MRRFLFILSVFFCISLTAFAAPAAPDAGARLAALNVGKGDCLLLMLGDNAYLIDSGYDYTWNLLREALTQYGVSRLNGVFLTHCDKDHAGGLLPLAQSDIAVDAWYAAAIYYDVKPGEHPMELAAAERGDTVRYLNAGDALSLGADASLRVVGPLTCNTENENNNSLVFYVDTAEGTLLFTGDMKLDEEYELLQAGLITAADLLKVPFHGDNTASSQAFVEAVNPQIALISTSSVQEPDTPASSVLKRYGKAGAGVIVTQEYPRGVELTLRGGKISAEEIVWDLPDYSRYVTAAIDRSDDLLILRSGSDQDISLAGWIVFSTRGEECVTLPADAVLPANGVFTLGTRATDGDADLRADIKRLWHKSKFDRCVVFDASGGVASVTDNGIAE